MNESKWCKHHSPWWWSIMIYLSRAMFHFKAISHCLITLLTLTMLYIINIYIWNPILIVVFHSILLRGQLQAVTEKSTIPLLLLTAGKWSGRASNTDDNNAVIGLYLYCLERKDQCNHIWPFLTKSTKESWQLVLYTKIHYKSPLTDSNDTSCFTIRRKW